MLRSTEGKNVVFPAVVPLKNQFLGLAQVEFSVGKRHKMSIHGVRKLHYREWGTPES
jgi:hypothetical protein